MQQQSLAALARCGIKAFTKGTGRRRPPAAFLDALRWLRDAADNGDPDVMRALAAVCWHTGRCELTHRAAAARRRTKKDPAAVLAMVSPGDKQPLTAIGGISRATFYRYKRRLREK